MLGDRDIREEGKQVRQKIKRTFRQLKSLGQAQQDQLIQHEHEEVFAETECLECANCCRTAGPRITSADITRMARGLKISESKMTHTYLRIDPEDGEYIMSSLPCPFLGTDNFCSIYDFRPKACREYPHTNRRRQHQLYGLHQENLLICPAVQKIFVRLDAALCKS